MNISFVKPHCQQDFSDSFLILSPPFSRFLSSPFENLFVVDYFRFDILLFGVISVAETAVACHACAVGAK